MEENQDKNMSTTPEEETKEMVDDSHPSTELAMNGGLNGHEKNAVVSQQADHFDATNGDGGTDDGVDYNNETNDNIGTISKNASKDSIDDTVNVPGITTEEQEQQQEEGNADSKDETENDDEFQTPFSSEMSSQSQSENNLPDEYTTAFESGSNDDDGEYPSPSLLKNNDIVDGASNNNTTEKEEEKEISMDLLDFGTETVATTMDEPTEQASTLLESNAQKTELPVTVQEDKPSLAQDDFGNLLSEPVSTEPAVLSQENEIFGDSKDAAKPSEEISSTVETSESNGFGNFGEPVVSETSQQQCDFVDFEDTAKPVEPSPPAVETSESNGFGDFGETMASEPVAAIQQEDDFGDFGDPTHSVEPSPPTVEASVSDNFGEPVASEPTETAQQEDAFGDFGVSKLPVEATLPVVEASESDDFGDFGEPESAQLVATTKQDDDFGDFGDSTQPVEATHTTPTVVEASVSDYLGEPESANTAVVPKETDDFGDFGADAKPPEPAPPLIEASVSDDFGDFSEPASIEPPVAPKEEDDFGDFGDATETIDQANPAVEASVSDDFGDFGESVMSEPIPTAQEGDSAAATKPVEATTPVVEASVSDDFGDFAEPVSAVPQEDGFVDTSAPEQPVPVEDEDDFGDFNDFNEAEALQNSENRSTPAVDTKKETAPEMDDDDFGDFGGFDEAAEEETEESKTKQTTQAPSEENDFGEFGTFDDSGSAPPKDPLLEKAEAIFKTAFGQYGNDNVEDVGPLGDSKKHMSIGSILTSLPDKEVGGEKQQWHESNLSSGLLDIQFLGDDKAEVIVSSACVYPNEHHAFPLGGSFQRNLQRSQVEISKGETKASLPSVPEVLSIELPTGNEVRKAAIPESSKDCVDPSLISSATVVELPPLESDKEKISVKTPMAATNVDFPLSQEPPLRRKDSTEGSEDFGDFEAFGDADVSFAPVSDTMSSSEKQAATEQKVEEDFGEFDGADFGENKSGNSGNLNDGDNDIKEDFGDFEDFDDEKNSAPSKENEGVPCDSNPNDATKYCADDDDFGDFGGLVSDTQPLGTKGKETNLPESGNDHSFGDFGEAAESPVEPLSKPAEESTDPQINAAKSDDFGDFGEFVSDAQPDFGEAAESPGEPLSQPTEENTDPQIDTAKSDDFGDFGAFVSDAQPDFGDATESPDEPLSQPTEENTDPQIDTAKSDDFGDFGEFVSDAQPDFGEAAESPDEPLSQAAEENTNPQINTAKSDDFGDFGEFVSDAQPDFGKAAESPDEPLSQPTEESTDPQIDTAKSDDFGDFGEFVSDSQPFSASDKDVRPTQDAGDVTLSSGESALEPAKGKSDQEKEESCNFGGFASDIQPADTQIVGADKGDDDDAFGDFGGVSSDGLPSQLDTEDGQLQINEVVDKGSREIGGFVSALQPTETDTENEGIQPVQTENGFAGFGEIFDSSIGTTAQKSTSHVEPKIDVLTNDDFGEFGAFSSGMHTETSVANKSGPDSQASDAFFGDFEQPSVPSIDPMLEFSATKGELSVNPVDNGMVELGGSVKDNEVLSSADPAPSSAPGEDQDADFWVFEGTVEPKGSASENTASQWVEVANTLQPSALNSDSHDIPGPNADDDSFGDFGAANDPTPVTESTAEKVMPQTVDDSDEFGDFEEIVDASPGDMNGVQEESDDFGDFENAANDLQNGGAFEQASGDVATPQYPAAPFANGGDFDDFGDFTSSTQPVAEQAIDVVGPFLARVPDWTYMLKTKLEFQSAQPSQSNLMVTPEENGISTEKPIGMNGFH